MPALLFFAFYSPRNDITNLIATLFNFLIFSTCYFLIYTFIPKQKNIVKINYNPEPNIKQKKKY